jgi:hypothetical protein
MVRGDERPDQKMVKLQIGSLFWKSPALGGYGVDSAINIAR